MKIQLDHEGYQPPKSGLVLLQCLVGALFFIFVTRFWYLQIHKGEDFARQAQNNRLRYERVYASRGLIRDVNGEVLAENRPAFGLALIREDCRDISATLAQVGLWLDMPFDQLFARYQQDIRKVKPFEPVLLISDMPFELVARIEAELMRWPGLEIVTRSKRHYPGGNEFAHILGYVAEANEKELAADAYLSLGDTVGKQGLEYVLEQRLRGRKGKYSVEVDVLGRSLGKTLDEGPQNGENVQLCLDAVNGIGGVILHADLAVDDGAFLHNQGRGAQLAEERPGSMDRHAAGSPCLPAEGAAQHKFAHIKSALDNGILAHDERAFRNDFAGKLPVDPHGPLKRQFAVIYRA